MISTEEALKAVLNDPKMLEEIASHFDKHNPEWGKMFKANPEALMKEINKAIAEMESFSD